MSLKVKVKKFKAEIVLIVAVIIMSAIITCSKLYIDNSVLEKAYTVCLPVILASIGLYFTAFTIFVGLGLSPKKLDSTKLKSKLLKENWEEEDIDKFIEEKVISPYKDSLSQAASNFRDTIAVLFWVFAFAMLVYALTLIAGKNNLSCSVACSYNMNSLAFSYIILSTIFAPYLIYDSAKFLVNVRKLL